MKATASAIYEGWVRHRRHEPVRHEFRYRLFMLYLDLSEIDGLFDGHWLWSTRRPAPARFRRRDHLGDPEKSLDDEVRRLVEHATGRHPLGPIRLLTNLRYFGHGFNPVSFYYVFDPADRGLETIVAEVGNTPWGERHCYVLDGASPHERSQSFRCDKEFHVSPFSPMDVEYLWHMTAPGEDLAVHIESRREGSAFFDATLRLDRRKIETAHLARVLFLYPVQTLRILMSIHWQALRLWLKRSPVHDHPSRPPTTEGR